ncbi:MAG: 2,4-dihydroxyhept-2-ene-1,7-dioic acid aldolase [Elusimicrobia bacterium]|nr:2,4-dihydroxyhept-2-ene-1,7-dioic acid aldolase [Elusimicrobiota bacterium]
MARAGFEWLAIDLEHSVITIREAEELIRVIELCGVSPLVRLSWNDPIQIKRVMDAGAHGVIVPMVNTADEARRAVEAVKYPPRGRRGVGLARAQGYGASFERYHQWVERESVVIVQIEHIRAVENLRSILEVPGVDGFMVGPYDISGSLGLPGEFEHPKFKEAIKTISAVASAVDAMAGYHVVYPRLDEVEQKIVEGYRFIAYSTDALFLGESCRQGLNSIRTLQEKIKTAAPV